MTNKSVLQRFLKPPIRVKQLAYPRIKAMAESLLLPDGLLEIFRLDSNLVLDALVEYTGVERDTLLVLYSQALSNSATDLECATHFAVSGCLVVVGFVTSTSN